MTTIVEPQLAKPWVCPVCREPLTDRESVRRHLFDEHVEHEKPGSEGVVNHPPGTAP